MQRSCGSAGQPANHSAESSSVLNPAYLGYDDDATGDDDDASDEISDVSSCDGHTENADNESPSSVGQPASKKAELPLNQFETPLGLDPTSTPDFVQHVASFKAQLDLVQDAVKIMRSAQQPTDTSSAQQPTDTKLLENVDKAMFVTPRQQCRDMQGDSAEQPVTSLGTAEQPLSSSAPHWDVNVFPGSEMQPSKRCKYDGMMVCSKDLIVPEILQPINAALAEEIAKSAIECEQWDPPNFGEDATQEDQPKFLMTKVYERLRSKRAREGLPAYTAAQIKPIYAVLKGLLALLHSDVHCVFLSSSVPLKKQIVANDLYADLCSYRMQEIFLSESNVELLALAVRQQTINNNKDDSRHAFRYLKYLADFAELHAL